jgi:hypothetical protein
MSQWSVNLKNYAAAKKRNIKNVRRVFVFNAYSSVVRRTPVDTGRARGNWNVSLNQPDNTTGNKERIRSMNFKSLPEAQGDESYFITNNLPYITKLEDGGYPNPPKKPTGKTVNGYSRQAPNGMVAVTIAEVDNLFSAAVREADND